MGPHPYLSCQEERGISAFVFLGFVSKWSVLQLQGSKCPQAPKQSFPYGTTFSKIEWELDIFSSSAFFSPALMVRK